MQKRSIFQKLGKGFIFLCFFFSTQTVFSDNYLISYPRSGLHWTIYQLVSLTHMKCCGDTAYFYWGNKDVHHIFGKYDNPEDILLNMSHILDLKNQNLASEKIILILRDFKECLPRNLKYDIDRITAVISLDDNYISMDDSYDVGLAYFTNLYEFDQFEGEKLLIYYEDMMTNPKKVICQVLEFLRVTPLDLDEFYQNLSRHKLRSLARYAPHGGSKSKGADMHFHAKKLKISVVRKLDILVQEKHPLLWEKYLKRYKISK